jgi:hypothetical protein
MSFRARPRDAASAMAARSAGSVTRSSRSSSASGSLARGTAAADARRTGIGATGRTWKRIELTWSPTLFRRSSISAVKNESS